MTEHSETRTQPFKVVLNHEEQYSIWPEDRENAPGWTDEGTAGSREECLAHIERVWADMRPLSLRNRIAERVAAGAGAGAVSGTEAS
ncbi:antibiotic synthesis protein MbtH [Streptomyces sp. 150FB]|uniref:MbtH family protein n=1 Tax=Streptomyces sp. 150FB TaxID=1576605 RepID=UPI0005891535|nr:MbtH family protein [Streptomyces sp. 150FB]KIF76824.1 antibiotic synthesis protein MbtH [Streptomyces sp. 150FB]